MNFKRYFKTILVLCTFMVLAEKSFAQDKSYWVGEIHLMGFPVLLEIHNKTESIARIDAFGPAPLHYEFPLYSGDVEILRQRSGTSFTIRFRGQTLHFEGSGVEDHLKGQMELSRGDSTSTEKVTFIRAALPTMQENYMGLYGTDDGEKLLVTYREFGGLRAIDLETSENHSLINVDDGRFITWGQLSEYASDVGQIADIRFMADRLVWRQTDGEVLQLHKTGGLRQQTMQVAGPAGLLSGTLILPGGDGPYPGIVLVHGSGPIYRTVLVEQAVAFARMGVAALIYDKRGTGASGGDNWDASFNALADDLSSVHDWLQKHPLIDPSRTGVQGLSQAGYVIPIAAAGDTSIDFAIITNGGSINSWQQSLYDKANDFDREGVGAGIKERGLSLMRKLFAFVLGRTDEGRAELEAELRAAQSEPWFEITDLPRLSAVPSWENPPPALLEYYEELAFDPFEAQAQMHIPILVLLGKKDMTMPFEVLASGWRETARTASNDQITIRIIENGNHGMRVAREDGTNGRLLRGYLLEQHDWLKAQGLVSAADRLISPN